MHRELGSLQILDKLRSANGTRLPIEKLLDEDYSGILPDHTGAAMFGEAVVRLADAGFVKLFDHQHTEVTNQICKIGDRSDWTLRRGYLIADFLRGKERFISASLTSLLGEVQSVLGVSITQLIEDANDRGMRVHPIFGVPHGKLSSDVFVLMPFDQTFKPIFDDHILSVCRRLNLSCMRADNIFTSNEVVQDVWKLIANSRTIVADCTGRNPNVFYELGIAHTLGKRVVTIAQSADDIPFDIRHIRYIKYSYTPRGMKEFEETLEKYILGERLN